MMNYAYHLHNHSSNRQAPVFAQAHRRHIAQPTSHR